MLLAANPDLSAEDLDRVARLRGWDRSIWNRYGCWLLGRRGPDCDWWPAGDGVLFGDLGYSRVHRVPVLTLIADRLPRTLALMGPAFFGAVLLSIPLGVWAALRVERGSDFFVRGVILVGLSIPVHALGMWMVLGFAVGLRWFPASGVDDPFAPSLMARLHHLILPVGVLSLYYIARFCRYIRSSMLEVLAEPYIEAARARGTSEFRTVWVHALPNALLPFITVVAQSMPVLFSGALVVERVFAYPGMGLVIFESVHQKDYLVAVTVFLVYAALTFLAALVADLLYIFVDPRFDGTRLESTGATR